VGPLPICQAGLSAARGATPQSRCRRLQTSAAAPQLPLLSATTIAALIRAASVLDASEYEVGTYRLARLTRLPACLPAPGGTRVKVYSLFHDATLTKGPESAPVRPYICAISCTDATIVVYITLLWIFGESW
jgi:hypothetical protein